VAKSKISGKKLVSKCAIWPKKAATGVVMKIGGSKFQ